MTPWRGMACLRTYVDSVVVPLLPSRVNSVSYRRKAGFIHFHISAGLLSVEDVVNFHVLSELTSIRNIAQSAPSGETLEALTS